jgi:hypothetical protein
MNFPKFAATFCVIPVHKCANRPKRLSTRHKAPAWKSLVNTQIAPSFSPSTDCRVRSFRDQCTYGKRKPYILRHTAFPARNGNPSVVPRIATELDSDERVGQARDRRICRLAEEGFARPASNSRYQVWCEAAGNFIGW